jgi:hypothetical protein
MYAFNTTSARNFVWLNGGALFSDVESVEIEMVTAGEFRLEAVSPAGKLLSYGRQANPHGGWHTFDFNHNMKSMIDPNRPPYLSPFAAPYKLRLVNLAPGVMFAKQGSVNP